jgi:hypothetical protein
MNNMIKVMTGILIITLSIFVIECTTGAKTEGTTDSTSVVVDTVQVDSTHVDGGDSVSVHR